jgi:hypothetical protein
MLSRSLISISSKLLPQTQKTSFLALNALFTRTFASNNNSHSVQFPRKEVNVSLNWALAKHFVVPKNTNIILNSVAEGVTDNNRTRVLTLGKEINGNAFKEIHQKLTGKLSKSEKVYAEEGEIEGLYVRVITCNEELAKAARGALKIVKDSEFEANATVILGEDENLNGVTLVDVVNGTILSGSANKESLAEAVRQIGYIF